MTNVNGVTIGDLIARGELSLDTRVIGSLVKTADGYLVGTGANIWYVQRRSFLRTGQLRVSELLPALPADSKEDDFRTEVSVMGRSLFFRPDGGTWNDMYASQTAADAAANAQLPEHLR